MSVDRKQRKKTDAKFMRGRSVMLFQITVLVLVVVLISGAASLIIFRRSRDRLIEKSKDKLIENGARDGIRQRGIYKGRRNRLV